MPFLRSLNLSFKLAGCLIGGMVLVFSLLGYWTLRLHRGNLEEVTYAAGDRLSDTIKRSTRFGMLENHSAEVRGIIRAVGAQPGIERIRIINKAGEVRFSTDPRDERERVDKQAEACYTCHARDAALTHLGRPAAPGGLTRAERMRVFRDREGRRVLGVINPIENEPSCSTAECHAHAPETRILGVVDVTLSLERVDAVTAESGWQMTLNFVAAGLVLAAGAGAVVWFLVHKPVRQLITGTQRVGWGDLDYRIRVSSRGELGELADSFNRMTGKLRQAQGEIGHWTRTLESRVAAREAELRRAHGNMVAVEKMASIGKLAAIVAHEINNPLAGILVYAKLLLKRAARAGADEETRSQLETIAAESARCGEIVKGLLQFSRQTKPRPEPADVNELVRQSVRLVQHKLDLMGARAEVTLDPGVGTVVCDAQQLKQALVALLINACEALRQEGGRVSVATRRLDGRGAVEVSVADDGVGMDAETRRHIFEPFFTTKEQGKGTGLGLSIVYGIVHAHGGHIAVESAPGAGSAFTLRLPDGAAGGGVPPAAAEAVKGL